MSKKTLNISLTSRLSLDMILVEGGNFMMGDDNSKNDREKPARKVEINSFYVSKYQVTQAQWQEIMGSNPSGFKGENHPVETISWNEAQEFLKRINGKTAKNFRLPTEAEWAFAAKGGNYSEGYIYAGSDKLKQVGWYSENAKNETQEVGQLLANELGLYDMSGNVREWCEDDWHSNYEGAPADGSAWVDSPARGSRRVLRGGDCFNNAEFCRSAYRYGFTPVSRDNSIGFRLVLPLQSVG